MTLTEVERKRALDTGAQAALLDRLHELAFRERARHVETDDYYSRPDVDFMETVECLRVRSRDGLAEITYKPGSTAANTAEGMIAKVETNARLVDAEQAAAANQLLTMLGMVHLAQVDKHRVEYAHVGNGDVTIAVDTITNVGIFIEVEVLTADPAGAAAVLDRIERDLGTTELPIVSLPYRDLVMQANSPPEHHHRQRRASGRAHRRRNRLRRTVREPYSRRGLLHFALVGGPRDLERCGVIAMIGGLP